MSVKRGATTELNHENWDQDEPEDAKEMGAFKTASKEELGKRVIKTAKRRTQMPVEGTKSVFSGFGGFNKAKTSFDFLANLTNGSKPSTPVETKNDSAVSSSLFGSKPIPFQIATTSSSAPVLNSTFGLNTQKQTLFGSPSSFSNSTVSPFSASKADSTVGDVPSKTEPSSTSDKNKGFKMSATPVSTSKVSSSVFGTTSASLFSNTPTTATPFKIQSVSSTTSALKPKDSSLPTESKPEENPKRMKYYSKLKGLNESVSEWIKKHVGETPLCILTPIFKDYEKYLKEIQEEYEKNDPVDATAKIETKADTFSSKPVESKPVEALSGNKIGSTLFSTNNTSSVFAKTSTSQEVKPSLDSISPAKTTTNTPPKSTGFSFGIAASKPSEEQKSPFSFAPNSNTTNGAKPFSFGIGQPFSFSPNTQTSQANTECKEEEENDEPPKVEFTPVVEENSVYDKRCKVFVKKDDNFVDKGIGTLYLKKLDSGKHQLIVRANTNLGNVLLNMILSSSLPTQRMGKNNVMIMCIPTPEAKPPPVPVLIRVKTPEEADELLETLNKHKS